ncbi:MAG TPA: DinB family protein [Dehalococcoidia bacterium]
MYGMRSHPYGYLLKALTEGAGEIREQLLPVPDEAARWRPAEDEWAVVEIAAHLRDAEGLYGEQIRCIARRPGTDLPVVDLEGLAAERRYLEEDLHQALAQFTRLRRITASLLWELDPDDWERTGHHRYRGDVSIAQIARELNQHDLSHLWQARRVLEQWRETEGRGASW